MFLTRIYRDTELYDFPDLDLIFDAIVAASLNVNTFTTVGNPGNTVLPVNPPLSE